MEGAGAVVGGVGEPEDVEEEEEVVVHGGEEGVELNLLSSRRGEGFSNE